MLEQNTKKKTEYSTKVSVDGCYIDTYCLHWNKKQVHILQYVHRCNVTKEKLITTMKQSKIFV